MIVSCTMHTPHRFVNHTAFSVPTFLDQPQQYSVVVYVTLSPPLLEG